MSEHTPKPWVIDDGLIRPKDMAERLTEDDGPEKDWVAVGIEDHEGFAASVAYCHPINAKLIAAAPELLATLDLAMKTLSNIPASKRGLAINQAIEHARMAITKATK